MNTNVRSGKFALVALICVAVLFLMFSYFLFRGPLVKVPGAHVGRVKTASGFGEQRGPSLFRLPSNWFGRNPTKLILAETSDHRVEEKIEALYMPLDNLNLAFQVVGTFAVSSDKERIDNIYNRITPANAGEYVQVISFDTVYHTYGQQAVRTILN